MTFTCNLSSILISTPDIPKGILVVPPHNIFGTSDRRPKATNANHRYPALRLPSIAGNNFR